MKTRFNLRDLFWLVLVVALLVRWWSDQSSRGATFFVVLVLVSLWVSWTAIRATGYWS